MHVRHRPGCDDGTTQADEDACVSSLLCGDGTRLRDGQCVPSAGTIECAAGSRPSEDGTTCLLTDGACDSPAQFDPDTGRCVAPEATRCGNGTQQRGSFCVPSCDGEFETQNSTFTGCEPAARIQIVHASADPAVSALDIYSGSSLISDDEGNALGDDLAFQTATPVLKISVDSGLPIRVARQNSMNNSSPLAAINSGELEAGRRYLAVIVGVENTSGFVGESEILLDVLVLEGLLEQTRSASDVQFAFIHAATDAHILDVVLNEGTPETLFSAASYGSIGGLGYTNQSGVGPPVFPRGVNPLIVIESGDTSLTPLVSVQTSAEPILPEPDGFTSGTVGVLVATGFVDPNANRGSGTTDGAELEVLAVLPSGQASVLDTDP
ncbi:MAG: hypothetical protein AAFV36_05640 [Myxococcota bacterium]